MAGDPGRRVPGPRNRACLSTRGATDARRAYGAASCAAAGAVIPLARQCEELTVQSCWEMLAWAQPGYDCTLCTVTASLPAPPGWIVDSGAQGDISVYLGYLTPTPGYHSDKEYNSYIRYLMDSRYPLL